MSGWPRRGGWREVEWTDCSGSAGRATDREVRVVAAVLRRVGEAAAHRLGLSHSTVKHHLANARSKVGARRRRSSCGSWRRGCLSPRLPPSGRSGSARGLFLPCV